MKKSLKYVKGREDLTVYITMKESRLTIRLVALWVIFVGSLALIFWSFSHLTIAVVKQNNGGYQTYTGYIGGCLQPPVYPSFSGDMPLTEEDKALNEQYLQQQEAYNAEVTENCMADMANQEIIQKRQEKSAALTDIYSSGVMVFIGVLAAMMSAMMIKQTEEE